jgi:hypothetical protein
LLSAADAVAHIRRALARALLTDEGAHGGDAGGTAEAEAAAEWANALPPWEALEESSLPIAPDGSADGALLWGWFDLMSMAMSMYRCDDDDDDSFLWLWLWFFIYDLSWWWWWWWWWW